MTITGDGTLADRHRTFCQVHSDIREHLPTFVDLVVERDCRHVIELGTRHGLSTVAFLYGLEQTGGSLVSIDLGERPDIGEWPHWQYIRGDDLDPEVFRQCEPADLVFIDTTHGYTQTLRELNLYSTLIRRPGLMVLHDTELKVPDFEPATIPYPVKKAVTEFCEAEGYEWTNNPECWGLAIIEVN